MHIFSVIVLFLVLFCSPISSYPQDNGGGLDCAACTVVVSLLEQLSLLHNKSVEALLDDICTIFPSEFTEICKYFVNTYGDQVIKLFDEEYNPDEICYAIAFCTDSKCHLWPPSGRSRPIPHPYFQNLRNQRKRNSETPWDWLINLLKPIIDHSEPVLDFDGDLFSVEPTLRGSSWRGRDCNDIDSTIYAGRKENQHFPEIDHNCNGIYAINGLDYDDLYCKNSGQLGVAIIGDSAGAHFHIPPEYMTASEINEQTFSNLLFVLSNEFDVPQESSTTGHENTTGNVFVDSMYLRMRERNRCNHRDYQNICRNGLRSGSSVDLAKTLSRNKTTDHPVLLTFELIGNDVCTGHQDFNHFTSPEEFRNNILEVLGNFSETLPMGSHVIFMGLAHGGVLWDALHDRKHPIGAPYSAVYDLLNCLQISPCWGWMNSNGTVRNITNDWALKLSGIYDEIISTRKYPNFDMIYYPFPLEEIYKMWQAQGGELWQLIEPIDGFHPNQQSNALIVEWMFNDILKNHPEFLGDINPYNSEIDKLFGAQNGY